MQIKPGDIIVFAGDSVTDAGRDYRVSPGEFGSFGDGYVDVISKALVTIYPEYANKVVNAGVNGNDIRLLRARFSKDVIDESPNIVFILIGINDVWRQHDRRFQRGQSIITPEIFEKTYQILIDQCLKANATPIVIEPFMFDTNEFEPMRRQLTKYQKIAQTVAQRNKLLFIEMQDAINHFLLRSTCYIVTQDRVHPNNYGHFLVAKTILNAIGFDWNHVLTEGGNNDREN